MFGFDDDFGLDDLIEADIQFGLFEDDDRQVLLQERKQQVLWLPPHRCFTKLDRMSHPKILPELLFGSRWFELATFCPYNLCHLHPS